MAHVQALEESLFSSVRKTVLESQQTELEASAAVNLKAFSERLDIIGSPSFNKESSKEQNVMTPSEIFALKLRFFENEQALESSKQAQRRLETEAKGLKREVTRLQGEAAVAAADRETLLQTLMACRKSLARAEVDVDELRGEVKRLEGLEKDSEAAGQAMAEQRQKTAEKGSTGVGGGGRGTMDIVLLLEHERRSARGAREDLERERAARTEAQKVLLAAIADARAENDAEREGVVASLAINKKIDSAAADELLSAPRRSQVLSDLLSQEAILAALYSVVFPPSSYDRGLNKQTIEAQGK